MEDDPFHLSMVAEDHRPDLVQQLRPDTDAPLQVYIVDSATGILHVARSMSLSPQFTLQLHDLNVERAKKPMKRAHYNAALDQA